MPTPVIERLAEVQDKVVETVESFQAPVVDSVKKAIDLVEDRVPNLPTEAVADRLPTARELVENQFQFATRMLQVSHDFAIAVIDAVEPVTAKVTKAEPAPRKAKPAAKKTAEAA